MTQTTTSPAAPVRHQIYVPGYAGAKLGLAVLGLVLIALSFDRLGPLLKLGLAGGRADAEAVRIVLIDGAGQAHLLRSDAEVTAEMKAMEDARDRRSAFWVEYRFLVNGLPVEARAPLGQHVKPLHMLRDESGLPCTAHIWYDRGRPDRIALPYQLGTWFTASMLMLFGVLAAFMGTLLWWNAKKPIEMPDLSRSHGEEG